MPQPEAAPTGQPTTMLLYARPSYVAALGQYMDKAGLGYDTLINEGAVRRDFPAYPDVRAYAGLILDRGYGLPPLDRKQDGQRTVSTQLGGDSSSGDIPKALVVPRDALDSPAYSGFLRNRMRVPGKNKTPDIIVAMASPDTVGDPEALTSWLGSIAERIALR